MNTGRLGSMSLVLEKEMFAANKILSCRWVAIFSRVRTDRNLILNGYQTRCIVSGAVHEFITCEDQDRVSPINRVGYLGFAEFLTAGVIAVGDELWLDGDHLLGHVLGFDDTHMPNHQNIVFQVATIVTGSESGLVPDQEFCIRSPRSS